MNKKVNWAIGLSLVTLLVSVGIVVLWICQAYRFSVVSLDSFVGVIVALLAVIVTVAVGSQIVNVMEVKSAQRKYEDELKNVDKLLQQNANYNWVQGQYEPLRDEFFKRIGM